LDREWKMASKELEKTINSADRATRKRQRLRSYYRLFFWLVLGAISLLTLLTLIEIVIGPRAELSPVAQAGLVAILVLGLTLVFGAMAVSHLLDRVKRSIGPERGTWQREYDPAFRKRFRLRQKQS